MRPSGGKTLKPGHVLEVQTPIGLSYVQYVGNHEEYGDVIRVLAGCHKHHVTDVRALVGGAGYLAFYPASAAVTRGLVEVVDLNALPTEIEVPRNLRRAGARGRTGEIVTWIVEDGEHEIVRKELSKAERELPIAAIWDHELLILRICQGWSPEQEG